jgi:DNA-binding MarR family transcriptional regulator
MTQPERPMLTDAIRAFFEVSALFDPQRLRIWDAEGLTVTQLRLLAYVSAAEGISNAELADKLYVTRPSVSALLDRLERGGYLRREISPTDRRGIRIWLEERGRNAVSYLGEENWAYAERLFESMSDSELGTVAGSLNRLLAVGRERRASDLRGKDDPD